MKILINCYLCYVSYVKSLFNWAYYILNPLDFCSLCTELRRFCCNFSHCSLNHCTMGCRLMVSTNLCSSVKSSSSILQTASFILNACLCCVEYSLPLQTIGFLLAKSMFIISCVNPADLQNFSICSISLITIYIICNNTQKH